MKKIKQNIEVKAFIALILCTLHYSCNNITNPNEEKSITIFAAAGLTEPLSEIIDSFMVEHNLLIISNFASSGTLARQIEQGEVPNIYLSASLKWMKYIINELNLSEDSIRFIAKDRLVIIAPKASELNEIKLDSNTDLKSILGENKLSIGDPAHVPAGEYAKQALSYFKLYSTISNNINPAKDVRSAVMLVEMSESPIGIAYYTVAKKSDKIKMLGFIPEESHKPIQFTAITCKEDKDALEFINFLNSESAKKILIKYGFI